MSGVDLTRKILLTPREAEAIVRLGQAVDDLAGDERRIKQQLHRLRSREAAR